MDKASYHQYDWGDLIEGTKAQLQALGLGSGLPFPGEPGAPKRSMRVRDRRGYKCEIRLGYGDPTGIFNARVYFPNWPERPAREKSAEFPHPGVRKTLSWRWDSFKGSMTDLVAAGLALPNQFPGQPGMRKCCVTIFADGAVASGPPTANYRKRHEPGARWIQRISAHSFEICIVISHEEAERRREKYREEEALWEQALRGLPRPPKLDFGQADVKAVRRSHLRLVWSADRSLSGCEA